MCPVGGEEGVEEAFDFVAAVSWGVGVVVDGGAHDGVVGCVVGVDGEAF